MSQPSFELDEQADPDFAQSEFAADEANPSSGLPPAPQYRKKGFSIYTVMLIISFVCLLTTMIMMFIEAGQYN